MSDDILELIEEVKEILVHKREAYDQGELTYEQYLELRNQTLLDMGYQMEIITEPVEVSNE